VQGARVNNLRDVSVEIPKRRLTVFTGVSGSGKSSLVLLSLLDRLVDSGTSVIVIEHHQAVMAHADWIIDLGVGAGHDGGRIVFEGTPADLVAARSTLTGKHLAAYVDA
jgi:excinuclease UvrABC ATPase subunit